MAYSCKIIADSIAPTDVRLTTFEITFPRMVLAEFNTHRMFSRNSASSRAIPVDKQIARVLEDPFIPIYWGKNQKGMQADEELSEEVQKELVVDWLKARDSAVHHTEIFRNKGVHKQITNRFLETFMWHTVIVTATDWSNFFNLRNSPKAQPEIQYIANEMQKTYLNSWPSLNAWHLPYAQPGELEEHGLEMLIKLCVARCARVSYLTHDGKRDVLADLNLYNSLLDSGHMSPMEHVARSMTLVEAKLSSSCLNFKGWIQHRAEISGEADIMSYRRKEQQMADAGWENYPEIPQKGG